MKRAGIALLFCCAVAWVASAWVGGPAVHFKFEPIDFKLESSETPEAHAPETMAGGVAVFDYNNDGHLDIFFTNGADIRSLTKTDRRYRNRLFEGDGEGRFKDVTERAGLSGTGFDNGVAVGDYDNDGFKDLFVGGVHAVHLFHNNGDATFTDVTARSGLGKPDTEYGPLWSVGGAWVDVNNDGLLDLFVLNYLAWNFDTEPVCEAEPGRRDYCHPKFFKPTPNQLFLNNGDGTFRDVSAASGIREHPGKGMGVAVLDYDLDGLPDLFVSNDKLYNSLFHYRGDGKFEEVAFTANVALTDSGKFISGMGVDSQDVDNDGYPDLASVALDNETFPLFRNTGKRSFVDATLASGLGRLSLPMAGYSPNIADFDNDGWKDLFVSRGHVQSPGSANRMQIDQPNTVFRNTGGLKFEALTAEAGLAQRPARHRGSAIGDFNGDGALDVVVSALAAPAEIWINDTAPSGNWLAMELQGSTSNRDGIGARIKVAAGTLVQHRYVSFASGYASSSAGPTHFGLGANAKASLVEIRWPSGIVQRLRDVPANRVVRVTVTK